MEYFATASGPLVREAMACGHISQIITPKTGNKLTESVRWVADNAAFTGGYPGDDEYLKWLGDRAHLATDCAFAVAPDVPFDAAGTLALSAPMLPRIRALGYPAALCAQDGLELLDVPWDDFDVLFIAGSTEWKVGPHAQALTAEAKRRGKWVHMGRVNSWKRLKLAASWGVDSCDGTYLAFGPDHNLPILLSWLDRADAQLPHSDKAVPRQIKRPFVMPAPTPPVLDHDECDVCIPVAHVPVEVPGQLDLFDTYELMEMA